MRLRTRILLTATIASTVAVAGALPANASTASTTVLSQGHVDVLDIAYEDGELAVHVHDEVTGELDPCSVVLKVKPEARTTVPADPAYAFLGAAGDPVWVLPQVEDPNLLFAGLATEEIAAGQLAGDSVTIKLTSVYGPGDVSVFTTDEFGAPSIIFDEGDGLPDTHNLAAGVHQHANWAFEAAGWYWLTFKVTAKDAFTGAHLSSGPVTIRFQVVS